MSNLLFYFFKDKYTRLFGLLVKFFLVVRGIKIGKNFKADKFPKIILQNSNLNIGDNVTFYGDVEIRLIKQGSINIKNDCKIDSFVRIISNNNANVTIDEGNVIGIGTIINAGTDIYIGKKCLISGYVYLQSASHGFRPGKFMRDQEHSYKPIKIYDDAWIGSHTTVLKGVIVNKGAIIGANSVVKQDTTIGENQIFTGNPAEYKKDR